MIINISEYIHLVMADTQHKLNSYTYPVFVNNLDNRPTLIGSSLIIEVDDKTFLVTAAHVVSQVHLVDSPFYITSEETFIAVPGNFISSAPREGQPKDHFDISFVNLDDSFVETHQLNVVPKNSMMANRQFDVIHLPLIHGYPCSKNKTGKALYGGTKFRSMAYTYGGKIDKDFANWDKYNKSKLVHTCMTYSKARDMEGKGVSPPSPKGISGGGLWLLPDSSKPENVYLEAIFIEFYTNGKISFSTKISEVIGFIKKYDFVTEASLQ